MAWRSERPVITCTYYEGRDVPPYSKGVFTPEWADRLYRGCKRNTTTEFEFVVVTDEPQASFAEPVETLRFDTYRHNMWCIVECLRVSGAPVLFVGLDTVVTGNIDAMLGHETGFAMIRDPNYDDRMCSGVMMWRDRRDLFVKHLEDPDRNATTLAGHPSDMAWLERNGKPEDLTEVFPGQLKSFKCHVLKDGLGDARIVYFHGRQKPHEIDHPITEHWI